MVRLYNQEWRRDDLLRHVGRIEQIGGIRPVEATDGLERGNRLLQVRTGSGLVFDVLPDRALDISMLAYAGVPMVWSSPVGDASPRFYEPEGLGWLRTFQGGLFVTCGLDQFGAPSDDAGEALGLHGRVGSLPARAVAHSGAWVGDEYELAIAGEVRQARTFGENLTLRRRITTRLGSNRIRIDDAVINEGFSIQPHMMLYHFNLGFPLVSPASSLGLETARTEARDADAEAGLATWRSFQGPTSGYREQVFRHSPKADDDGRVRVQIENPTLGLGLRISYALAELPHLFQWKMMGEGIYALGIEPANSGTIEGRARARERGDLPTLEPGESRAYTLEVEVLDAR